VAARLKLTLFLLLVLAVKPYQVHAGILELLSQGAYNISGGTCPAYDEPQASAALKKAESECYIDGPALGVEHQVLALSSTLSQINGNLAVGVAVTYEALTHQYSQIYHDQNGNVLGVASDGHIDYLKTGARFNDD
jgi:hypothetical protein